MRWRRSRNPSSPKFLLWQAAKPSEGRSGGSEHNTMYMTIPSCLPLLGGGNVTHHVTLRPPTPYLKGLEAHTGERPYN